MARDEKRRQQSIHKKAAKREEKRQSLTHLAFGAPGSRRAFVRVAARWPLHECLVSSEWELEGALVQVIVARRSELGELSAAVILVDLGCLGVKNAFVTKPLSMREYEQLRERMREN